MNEKKLAQRFENKESPARPELRPQERPDVVRELGRTALRGARSK